jgi:hypothetical protein
MFDFNSGKILLRYSPVCDIGALTRLCFCLFLIILAQDQQPLTNLCLACATNEETVSYFFGNCPTTAELRNNIFTDYYLDVNYMFSKSPFCCWIREKSMTTTLRCIRVGACGLEWMGSSLTLPW